jgi:hypothetical protein
MKSFSNDYEKREILQRLIEKDGLINPPISIVSKISLYIFWWTNFNIKKAILLAEMLENGRELEKSFNAVKSLSKQNIDNFLRAYGWDF